MRYNLAVLFALPLFACSDATGPLPEDDIPGTYVLYAVSGEQLPAFVVEVGEYAIHADGGELLLGPGGFYMQTLHLRIEPDTAWTDFDWGVWSAESDAGGWSLAFSSTRQAGGAWQGSISRARVLVYADGFMEFHPVP
jgi:hypothetical protein